MCGERGKEGEKGETEKERIRGGLWGTLVGNKGELEDGAREVGECERCAGMCVMDASSCHRCPPRWT